MNIKYTKRWLLLKRNWKIRPVEAELFPREQTDVRMNTTKLIVAFRNVANTPGEKKIEKATQSERFEDTVPLFAIWPDLIR